MATAVMSHPKSAAGALALLQESDERLQTVALQQLAGVVDQHWSEISEHLNRISELSEEENAASHRDLAALVAAKCYFHLEEYNDALEYALLAGPHFNVHEKSEFVQTMIAKCIDKYMSLRQQGSSIEPRLASVVDRMFERCFNDGEYKQALGVAFQSRRLDVIEAAITRASDVAELLKFAFDTTVTSSVSRAFRNDVLSLLVRLFTAQTTVDHFSLARVYICLDDATAVANMLASLVSSDDSQAHLTAFQVGFDMVENQNQQFQLRVCEELPAAPVAASTAGEGAEGADKADQEPATAENTPYWDRVARLKSIVRGTVSVDLYVDFLCSHNHADIQLLHNIKAAIPVRDSMLHHALVMSHAVMQAGTTIDKFLLLNLPWLKRASNWARFSATAAQGVVHMGHVREAMKVLEGYLPKEGEATASPYLEGGALYALGLIHANQGNDEVLTYLTSALAATTDPVLQHGACLGLGLASMATADPSLWVKIKGVMFGEDADAGFGSGVASGLLLAGAGSTWGADMEEEDPVPDMLEYARETKHEKASRGVALGLALMCYGHEEEAADLITQMTGDKEAVIRYGGMYAIGMAYAGTSNNGAIRELLHVAVSDVSNDVRRAAVTNLGFVMLNRPERVPQLVSLLSESYNPHVRYGACVAVGIACAGSARTEAIELLEPLMEDKVDYVRQGAMYALAMVLQQETADRCPAVKKLRTKFDEIISNKRGSQLTKMGAILGYGILDAGGRNCVIALRSQSGFNKMSAIVGMALFQQHWFWFPCIHMLSLTLAPTALIGLNTNLKMPKNFTVTCNASKKAFAYPPMLKVEKAKAKKRVETAVLSTTAKANAKKRQKDKAKADAEGGEGSGEAGDAAADVDMKTGEEETKGDVEEVDENPFTISNPARVTTSQAAFVVFNNSEQRYVPVLNVTGRVGVVMLRDSTPEDEEDVVEIKPPPAQLELPEPDPPEPFEWVPN